VFAPSDEAAASRADAHDDARADRLRELIEEGLDQRGRGRLRVEPVLGDLSTRSYFRAHEPAGGASWIVARYPAELADLQRRARSAAELLASHGVRVPRIEIDDPENGLVLLEDLGPRNLYELGCGWGELGEELEAALAAARRIVALPVARVIALGSPPLDARLLRAELELTRRWFLEPEGLGDERLLTSLGELCDRLAVEPLVPCHRDLMARNLMPEGEGKIAVLDYQDLRLGPRGYDLASLLNDSLFADGPLERHLVAEQGELSGGPETYRRAVVQRTLKAVGTYCRLSAEGKRRHLPLVAPTLARAVPHLAELPETRQAWRRVSSRFEDALERSRLLK